MRKLILSAIYSDEGLHHICLFNHKYHEMPRAVKKYLKCYVNVQI